MIKCYETCRNCYYNFNHDGCKNAECQSCVMNYHYNGDGIADVVLCRCNMLTEGDECPYYKFNEETDHETKI